MKNIQSNILQKSPIFYDTFERKAGTELKTSHYCPGCGHGILHKLVAEALVDFEVDDRAVFLSPVGCSVFAYYYFQNGNIQSAHGRNPAVGTGYKRANPDSIVVSYQGDGDLASIGGNNILQAANRGENITVFFVNNATYGMTGGQMAPTTLVGQKSTTTPRGRTVENEGYPIRMSELLATLEAPVYIERVMLTDAKNIQKARKAVRKALKNQIDNKGFSFVEVLSACPTGWKQTPHESLNWIENVMEKYFAIGVKKDDSESREPIEVKRANPKYEDFHKLLEIQGLNDLSDVPKIPKIENISEEVKIAGFGGQGVLSLGYVLANLGMGHNYEVSWLPSYGPEMRGGTANCSVKISDNRIGAPIVDDPTTLIALNKPSLEKFENDVVKGGNIIYDSGLIDITPARKDINVYPIEATKIADKLGSTKAANMVLFGVYVGLTQYFSNEYIEWGIKHIIKKEKFHEMNINAFRKGFEFGKKNNSNE
ncbi:MAG: 2-oxoacid:acceptor oxidoreductase family protein [Candidatus Marinimicrobia bacterium]|nr:2-oxoacid:acceptor oxidoreductase family protein [Candidatus Neomarinimicrobiota bacterium]